MLIQQLQEYPRLQHQMQTKSIQDQYLRKQEKPDLASLSEHHILTKIYYYLLYHTYKHLQHPTVHNNHHIHHPNNIHIHQLHLSQKL